MKTNSKSLSLLLVGTMLFTSVLSGCSSKQAGTSSVKTVKIAFLNPLSGGNADAGKQDLDAAKLAVDDINAAGGIKSLGGAKVELVVSDTTSDPTQAKSVAERTFSSGDISGVVGTGISGLTLPILPILEKNQIPAVTNSISNDITKQGYKYIFETVPKGSMFGNTQVEFLKYLNTQYNLGITKVAIVYENSAYGVSTAKGVRDIAKNAGLDVVVDQSYPAGFTDASALVTSLKSSGAKAVFPVSYTNDAKLIISTMKSMNYSPLILGGGAGFLWPAFAKALGSDVNGFISVGSWNWDSKNISQNSELAKITSAFETKYGYYMTEHAGPTYTAVRLIAAAVEKAASSDSKKVRDALAQMDITSGPESLMQPGKLKFDETGWNMNVHPVMIQWQDGKPRTVFPLEDANAKLIVPTNK